MNLFIYDVTGYINLDSKGEHILKEYSKTDLFNPQYINSSSRTCTNLIVLEQGRLLMNCLGRGIEGHTTTVVITLNDMK